MTEPQRRKGAKGEPPEVSPAELGYRRPAEWHPHEATWLVWPKNEITWPGRVEQARRIFLEWIRHLAPLEKVRLLVDDQATEEGVRQRLRDSSVEPERVFFFQVPTVDSWIRDYGPNFLIRSRGHRIERSWNHWRFNTWGDKYEDLRRDAAVPSQLAKWLDPVSFHPDFVLDGGAIDVNGEGACLTTEQCLLNGNRNPGRSRREIEGFLAAYLGVDRIIWLGNGYHTLPDSAATGPRRRLVYP